MSNIVFIATSLDGYIADKDGGLDWLQSIPNPENLDMGWGDLIDRIDALVMGRKTFEKVCSFDCDWPYSKPVFVLSNSMKSKPDGYEGKAEEKHRGQVFILDIFICFSNLPIFFFNFLSFSIFCATRLQDCETPDSPMPNCQPISFNFLPVYF